MAAGLGCHEQLLGRPLLPSLWVACHFGGGKGVELEIVGRMHRNQLPLEMGRELGQLQTKTVQHAQDLVAIGLTLGGLLEVEKTVIPGRDLYTFEAESRGPPGYVFQFVEGLLVSGKLGQENRRAFYSLHRDTHSFQRSLLREADPPGTALSDGSFHEGHAAHALANAGYELAQFRRRIGEAGTNGCREVAIDISKCFDQPLGMPHGQAEISARRWGEIISGGMEGLTRLP